MAFHNKIVDGPMKQKTLVTTGTENYETMMEQHDLKVTEFNSKHNVFFNSTQSVYSTGTNKLVVLTTCLYADGAEQK